MARSFLVFGLIGIGALGAVFAACSGANESTPIGTATATVSVAASSSAASSGGGGAASAASSSSAGGSGGTGGATTTTGAGGGDAGFVCASLGDACSACTFAACNALYCSCMADSNCSNLGLCILPCGNGDNCVEPCYQKYPEAISGAVLLGSCAYMNCKQECPAAIKLDDCEICIAQSCPMDLNACYGDPECSALVQCIRNDCPGGDSQCEQNCALAHPTAIGKAVALQGCAGMKCSMPCTNF